MCDSSFASTPYSVPQKISGLFTKPSILWNRAFLSPDLEACTGGGYRLTYAEVNNWANRFSGLLEERGIRRGDRIALLCKNNEHVISAMFGAAKAGVITVF